MTNKEAIIMVDDYLIQNSDFISTDLQDALTQLIYTANMTSKYRKEMRRFKNKYVTLDLKYKQLQAQLEAEEDDKK